MKRSKLKAATTILAIALAVPGLAGLTATTITRECAAVGCGMGWEIAGHIALGILTAPLGPAGEIAGQIVFGA